MKAVQEARAKRMKVARRGRGLGAGGRGLDRTRVGRSEVLLRSCAVDEGCGGRGGGVVWIGWTFAFAIGVSFRVDAV